MQVAAAMLSGAVRTISTTTSDGNNEISKGERLRVDYSKIDLRALDKAIAQEAYIEEISFARGSSAKAAVVNSIVSTIPSIDIRPSQITASLAKVANIIY